MDKRAIYAILLTFFVIVFWTLLQSKFFPQTPSKPETKDVKKEQIASAEKGVEKKERVKESKPSAKPKVVIEKKEVSVETQYY